MDGYVQDETGKSYETQPPPPAHYFGAPYDARSYASTQVYSQRDPKQECSPSSIVNFSFETQASRPFLINNLPTRFIRDGAPVVSRGTAENLDVQYQKEQEAFEKRAKVFRSHQSQPYHHTMVAGRPTLWEQGHIVDKGRGACKGRPESTLTLSHDTQSYERPQSAPSTPAGGAPTWREDKYVQHQRGRYNPLTHEYAAPADPSYEAQRQKEFERESGRHTRGQAHKHQAWSSSSLQLGWDTDRSPQQDWQWKRPSTAPRLDTSTFAGDSPALSGAHPRSSGSHPPPPVAIPTSPGLAGGSGRSRHMAGESWGTYNPLTHEWMCPPANRRYQDQNAMVERQAGVAGNSLAKVPSSANHGVYNPIAGTWTVPPCDPREARGLSFAPASMFSKSTASTMLR